MSPQNLHDSRISSSLVKYELSLLGNLIEYNSDGYKAIHQALSNVYRNEEHPISVWLSQRVPEYCKETHEALIANVLNSFIWTSFATSLDDIYNTGLNNIRTYLRGSKTIVSKGKLFISQWTSGLQEVIFLVPFFFNLSEEEEENQIPDIEIFVVNRDKRGSQSAITGIVADWEAGNTGWYNIPDLESIEVKNLQVKA